MSLEQIFVKIKKAIRRSSFPFLEKPYHFLLSLWAALFYGFPSRRIYVIGVTGTKGKTTVVELLHEILASAGHKTASVSSLRFRVGDEEQKNELKMTMPGRMFLQKFLHGAAKKKYAYAIVEITSEGIKQYRHRFINFRVVVMTNIFPEHIESHGSLENYLRAKLDLFWRLSPHSSAVINRNDSHWQRFSASTGAEKVLYSKENIELPQKLIKVREPSINQKGSSFELENVSFVSQLPGEFNFYNILAAVSTVLALHVDMEKIAKGVEKVSQVAGRMEYIKRGPFSVVVDYAHTPDSLRAVYQTVKKDNFGAELICVLGSAGGGRDTWKRPVMAEVASQYCRKIVLTNEDPYDEDPEHILDQMVSGISHGSFVKILDRKTAINFALKEAGPGEVVIITGKGAEPWIMGPGGERVPWDDRQVARDCLRNL